MEIQFYGANCVRITSKKASIVVDDLTGMVAKPGDVALFTGMHDAPKVDVKIAFDQPGEYEVSDISIHGVGARAHTAEDANDRSSTMYKVIVEDVRVVILGHVYPDLNEQQLEALGATDVLLVPVGGGGYTLDAVGALNLIKEIKPMYIIPTHYADKSVNYEVPQASLQDVLKELAMEPKETVPRIKLKASELLGEPNQLIILERQ
jgi:L-ascorbate metabolism protein UlaG (beta-lactamase superfamily)